MAFIDVRLNECMAEGFAGGGQWDTELVMMDNGREKRNARWMIPQQRYSAQFQNLEDAARNAARA